MCGRTPRPAPFQLILLDETVKQQSVRFMLESGNGSSLEVSIVRLVRDIKRSRDCQSSAPNKLARPG